MELSVRRTPCTPKSYIYLEFIREICLCLLRFVPASYTQSMEGWNQLVLSHLLSCTLRLSIAELQNCKVSVICSRVESHRYKSYCPCHNFRCSLHENNVNRCNPNCQRNVKSQIWYYYLSQYHEENTFFIYPERSVQLSKFLFFVSVPVHFAVFIFRIMSVAETCYKLTPPSVI